MAKKSNNKPTTVNNIESVNVKIDYDKLAEAIVNAQEKAEIKSESNDKVRSTIMFVSNIIIYATAYFFALYCTYVIWQIHIEGTFINYFAKGIIIIPLIALAIGMFFSLKEAYKDTLKNAKIHFNTNISLVALFVAILAILKEIL